MGNELTKRIISSLVIFPLCLFFIYKGSYFFVIFIIILFLISIYEWINLSKSKNYRIYGLIFLFISFFSAFIIRTDLYNGENIFLFIILVSIMTDIGGYVFGRFFKGPKLTKISPNKTYSGMIGGFIMTLILIFVNIIYLKLLNFSTDLIVFALLISTISQLGDIIVSFFKRLTNAKDTGKIIPGHGGLLDRIDGIIFTLPFSYILLRSNIFQI